jgi:hypothetical protein
MIALSLEAELATCSLRWFSLVSLVPLEFPVSVNVMLVFISVMFFFLSILYAKPRRQSPVNCLLVCLFDFVQF